MRILHIYKDFYPPIYGGIEGNINTVCTELQKDPEFEVKVLVANRKFKTEQEFYKKIPIYKIADLGRFASAPLTPSFPYWLHRLSADILHFHLPNPTAVISYLLARPKGKVVVTWHSDIVRQKKFLPFYKPFEINFLHRVDQILPTSPNYIKSSKFLSQFPEKCQVVPLGIDLKQYQATPEILEQAKGWQEKYNKPIILFVGMLRYYKGLPFLFRALSKKNIDAVLLIAGDGPMKETWQNMVLELKLEKKVHFLGAITDQTKIALLHACHLFCLPACERSEAYGICQIEAFACSKPVLSTNLDTGVPFVNKHGVSGLVVPPRDPNALQEAICKILNNPEYAKKLGKNAKIRAEKEFSVECMMQLIKKVYYDLMKKES